MNIPKPQPPKKAEPVVEESDILADAQTETSVEEKREFVLKPHLTQRPFRNPDMASLRKTLEGKR